MEISVTYIHNENLHEKNVTFIKKIKQKNFL